MPLIQFCIAIIVQSWLLHQWITLEPTIVRLSAIPCSFCNQILPNTFSKLEILSTCKSKFLVNHKSHTYSYYWYWNTKTMSLHWFPLPKSRIFLLLILRYQNQKYFSTDFAIPKSEIISLLILRYQIIQSILDRMYFTKFTKLILYWNLR